MGDLSRVSCDLESSVTRPISPFPLIPFPFPIPPSCAAGRAGPSSLVLIFPRTGRRAAPYRACRPPFHSSLCRKRISSVGPTAVPPAFLLLPRKSTKATSTSCLLTLAPCHAKGNFVTPLPTSCLVTLPSPAAPPRLRVAWWRTRRTAHTSAAHTLSHHPETLNPKP